MAVSVLVTGSICGGAQTSAEFSFPCHSLELKKENGVCDPVNATHDLSLLPLYQSLLEGYLLGTSTPPHDDSDLKN